MRELEARSDGAYKACAGTIYPTLQQLEDEGLVTSRSEAGKRVYQLTEEGRATTEADAEAIARIWRRAESWSEWSFAGDPDAVEIARPAFRLARAAFRAIASTDSDPETIERVRQILERTRKELDALRHQDSI